MELLFDIMYHAFAVIGFLVVVIVCLALFVMNDSDVKKDKDDYWGVL